MGAVTSIAAARRRRIDAAGGQIEKLLRETRLKLIETGTRNRLIHTPRGAKRTRCLPIVEARPDAIFAALVHHRKMLRFLAANSAGAGLPEPGGEKIARLVPQEKNVGSKPGHASRNGLQTTLPPDLLQKRVHAIYRDARTAEEERGTNILFLALCSASCAGTRTRNRMRCVRRR